MGISWSTGRRRNNHFFQNPPHHSQFYSTYTTDPSPYPPPPPPPNHGFLGVIPYPVPTYPYPTPPPPPPPPPPPAHPFYYQFSGSHNPCGYAGQMMGGVNYQPYAANQSNGWQGFRPFVVPPPQLPPPPYVDHQMAKKIRNDVNVHKDSIKIEVDEMNPDCHLVSFTFDALADGSISIFYFAKEGENCRFTSVFPEAHMLVRIPFNTGLGQKFCQPSGTGIDLGFFKLDDLSKSSPIEDVFPLVIFAEACVLPLSIDGQLEPTLSHAQITQAILEKNNDGLFQAKVIKQILWVDGVRYELREIFGMNNSTDVGFDDSEPGKQCVICLTKPKDTAVLPCRHMCVCSECAKALRVRTNKCPICRQPIEELIEIKVNRGDQ